MIGVNHVPADLEPHVPLLMGLVFAQVRDRLGQDAPALRPSQLRVMEWLPADGLTITELAERTGMTTQGCGQFVRQLAGTGMVAVEPDGQDRRAKRVTLTDRGREGLARAHGVLAACEREWAGAVGEERYRVFREVLDQVARG
ncbi:MarR family transcriptional regulator [Microbacterium sp. ARD31]|uniref:MarR family winged helix-turn-helix transcriptional regulator n=1 Tax=Microbacterium sp. ARD31 TaxID=2962576 RepID=UPI002881A113|nr:MarR family transcriptional regulator [Microbacterium sp. ARD31]MDT0184605.1 MarR family transcriptional regulator [Microbacterium sp. ARD31]